MDKKKAIELLKQALNEIPSLKELHYDNQEFKLWRSKISDIIKAGLDKDDYNKYTSASPSVILIRGMFPDNRYQQEYVENLTRYETAIKSIIQKYDILGVEEKPTEKKETKDIIATPIQLFDAMQFHPKVIKVSESLFRTGNYPSAIFEAFKAVHNYVQEKTGLTLDGVNLMEKVFNENKPILQLNEMLTPSDKNEQKGFKYLFMGSQMGIRNPKAHENIKQEDSNKALEYLGIASLLMRRVDESKLVKLNIEEHKS